MLSKYWSLGLLNICIAAVVSLILCLIIRQLAKRFGAFDQPTGGRKIHQHPIPLWGGLGIGLTIIVLFLLQVLSVQIIGFSLGIFLLMVGGALDDRYNLRPQWQFLFIVAACAMVVGTGTNVVHVTNWAGGAPIELGWMGYVFAFVWMVVVTFAMKFMDGLDGLVSGQTVIGAFLIALLALSVRYFQPEVAVLSFIVAGAFLGFLPINFHPAKQFLGESGATIAGFSLGFLSILGGAKLATGLMALGFPLMDASFVILGRMSRGVPIWKGDDTHLHFKLLRAGLSQKKVVVIIWSVSLVTGLIALELQSIGKIFLVCWLLFAVLGLSAWAGSKSKQL
ncbi:MAG: MraY family glycosyltransferase [Candidatus Uhrbacteria bacterium]